MRLIFLGSPGSGKGTQAKLLSDRLGLVHIGTGDILRESVRLGTPEGLRAKPFVQTGKLVPDDLVNEIVASRFRRDDRPECFVMDGYPRTLAQANSFEQVLRQQFMALDTVIYLNADEEEIVRRLGGRWSCPNPKCNTTYQSTSRLPKVEGVCDICKTPLIQRLDDKPETIRHRLKVYQEQIEDMINYYRDKGILTEVKAKGDVEDIYASIVKVLKEAKPRV